MKRSPWKYLPLGQVCNINPGIDRSKINSENQCVSFIPMASVDEVHGAIASRQDRKYSEVSKGYTSFEENDVLFAKITPCMENGKAAIARNLTNGIGFGSTEFHVIRPGTTVLPEWILSFIRRPAFRAEAKLYFTGTAGQKRVPTRFLQNVKIPVPPISEQERIVRILDEAENLHRLREEADRSTADLIPAIFYEMFGDPVTNPKGWPMTTIGEIGGCGQYGMNIAASSDDKGIRYIRITDIDDDGSLGRCAPAYIPSGTDGFDKYLLELDDILIARSGATAGKSYIHQATIQKAVFAGYLIRFVIDRTQANPEYVFAFLHTTAYWSQLNSRKVTMAQPNVNAQKLSGIQIALPPIKLQDQFAIQVTKIQNIQKGQSQSNSRITELSESLLNRAFSGKL